MTSSDCEAIFARVYQILRPGKCPPIAVTFYAYADLDHTVRLREGRLLVRLSDVAVEAPEEIIEAIAFILLSKLLLRKIPSKYSALYRRYAHSPEVIAETAHTRALRSRPSPGDGGGQHRDLAALFARLNSRYFEKPIEGVRLLWSQRKSMRRLGYYRHSHHTIVVSQVLDDPRVPEYIVEFILFHEMLHAVIPSVHRNGRRYDHTPEFKAAERRFERYAEASRYLSRWPPPELRKRRRKPRSLPILAPLRQLRLF